MKIDTKRDTVLVRGELRETLSSQEARFSELQSAWSNGKITYAQLVKANEYKFSLNQLLFWDNCNFWDKIKVLFGRKEFPEQDVKYCRSVDPLYRDSILSKIIKYSSENGVMFSLKQMKSFDPQRDENYKENFEKFVKENNKK